MTKVVLLINDTEDVYHWGCYATSHALKDRLWEKGAEKILTVPVYDVHTLSEVPASVSEFGTKENFITRYPDIALKMSQCDLIVINGEGTIHDFGGYPKALLFLIYAGKTFFNKRCVLINHSCFPNSTEKDVIDFYKAAYSCCDYIAARETDSTHIIKEILGEECHLSFDSLPLMVRSVSESLEQRLCNEPYICIAGAVNYNVELSGIIAKRLLKEYPGHKFFFLTGSKKEGINFEDPAIYEDLKKHLPDLEMCNATGFDEWMKMIKHANLLISGRFHYTIAALCVGTPTVYFQSNTPKIDAIAKDLKLPSPVYTNNNFMFKLKLSWRLKQIAFRKSPPMMEKLCTLAEKNYDWEL